MKIALRIEASTFRGTRYGVPRLVEILKKREAGATFLFSLGPDHSGRALARMFRAGFLGRVRGTSVLRQHGIRALFYGTLLPAPDIGRECTASMYEARDAGFEIGVQGWDYLAWQDKAARADAQWTLAQMMLARERFEELFEQPARIHGAAGWQMNRHAYRLTQRLGYSFGSDTRGTTPFVPVCQAEIVACPQVPTTLPTFYEISAMDGIKADKDKIVGRMLELTQQAATAGQVFTLRAEVEGMRFADAFERLLDGWHAQGHQAVSLSDYLDAQAVGDLPRHEVIAGAAAGPAGAPALQGREFLAAPAPSTASGEGDLLHAQT
jgi:peptidoglycan/xylan/chitin deacetylase (PgdA/CDA1 family)